MDNFKDFFSRNKTPHTREHHQSNMRGFNRPHLNMVAFSKSKKTRHPFVDQILKSKVNIENRKITPELVFSIANTYGWNLEKENGKDFSNGINSTGIVIKRINGKYYVDYIISDK